MMKTFIIIGLVIIVVAPIVLIFRNLYDKLIYPAFQRSLDRIKSLIPRWIRGK